MVLGQAAQFCFRAEGQRISIDAKQTGTIKPPPRLLPLVHAHAVNSISKKSYFLPQDLLVFLPVGSPLSLSSSIPSSLAATPPSPAPLGPLGSGISSGMNANALPFYPTSETVESVVGTQGCAAISKPDTKRMRLKAF